MFIKKQNKTLNYLNQSVSLILLCQNSTISAEQKEMTMDTSADQNQIQNVSALVMCTFSRSTPVTHFMSMSYGFFALLSCFMLSYHRTLILVRFGQMWVVNHFPVKKSIKCIVHLFWWVWDTMILCSFSLYVCHFWGQFSLGTPYLIEIFMLNKGQTNKCIICCSLKQF